MRDKLAAGLIILLICIFIMGFIPLRDDAYKDGGTKEVFTLWYRHIQWHRMYSSNDEEYLDDPKYAKYFEPIETEDGSVDGYWVRTDFYVFPFNFISLGDGMNFFD